MKQINSNLIFLFVLAMNFSFGQTARVQVIHNSADLAAQTVDVYLDNVMLLNDFQFRTASQFINVTAGTAINLKVAPGTSNSSADFIYELNRTFDSGKTYVVVADGNISASGYVVNNNFSLEVYEGAREVANNSSNTDVLFHHGGTDAPRVNVNEVDTPILLVNGLAYKEFALNYSIFFTNNFTLNLTRFNDGSVIEEYSAPFATLNLRGAAITVLVSGFLDPSANSNGPALGLWAAKAEGGSLIELQSTSLSLNSLVTKDVKIYPNPVKDILNINFEEEVVGRLDIFDLSGRNVLNQKLNTINEIYLADLAAGMYLVKLSNRSGTKSMKINVAD